MAKHWAKFLLTLAVEPMILGEEIGEKKTQNVSTHLLLLKAFNKVP